MGAGGRNLALIYLKHSSDGLNWFYIPCIKLLKFPQIQKCIKEIIKIFTFFRGSPRQDVLEHLKKIFIV